MKISGDKPNPSVDPPIRTGGQPTRPAQAGHAEKGATSEDRVDFSEKAKDIQLAARVLAQTPEEREARVAALKRDVESGTYNVKAEQIAAKMVREALLDQLL